MRQAPDEKFVETDILWGGSSGILPEALFYSRTD